MIAWPGSLIGRPGRISWSLPNAMFEPQNEIDPTIAANSDGISIFSGEMPRRSDGGTRPTR